MKGKSYESKIQKIIWPVQPALFKLPADFYHGCTGHDAYGILRSRVSE